MLNANDMAELERHFRQINLIRSNKLRAKSCESAMAGAAAGVNDERRKKKESFNKNWNYGKSNRLAAKAYVVARQEIAIISSHHCDDDWPQHSAARQHTRAFAARQLQGHTRRGQEAHVKNYCAYCAARVDSNQLGTRLSRNDTHQCFVSF